MTKRLAKTRAFRDPGFQPAEDVARARTALGLAVARAFAGRGLRAAWARRTPLLVSHHAATTTTTETRKGGLVLVCLHV